MRFAIVKDARPASPMQQIKMARPAKMFVILLMSSSLKNFFPNSWSVNWYSKGTEGLNLLNTASIDCNAFCGCADWFSRMLTELEPAGLKYTIIGSTGLKGDSIVTLSVTPMTV